MRRIAVQNVALTSLENESASHIHTAFADHLHLSADSISDNIIKEKEQQTGHGE